jgi:hypothetical protein
MDAGKVVVSVMIIYSSDESVTERSSLFTVKLYPFISGYGHLSVLFAVIVEDRPYSYMKHVVLHYKIFLKVLESLTQAKGLV